MMPKASRSKRRGTPFTVYFDAETWEALCSLARQRRVTKTALIKFSVDEMLKGLQSGQLKLPLGIEKNEVPHAR
jgi:hypothetical protein